ncbi:hypothetical protein KCU77_g11604, partial [Aureobasidium melanogenum]
MNITRYRWVECPHVQHVNDSGQSMSWVEVKDPVNSIVDAEPSHDCPACEDPEVTHPVIIWRLAYFSYAWMNPYALTLPSNNYPAVQQPLDYQYQQQVYNPAGQTVMPAFYGPAGPMDFAGTIPTAGPTSQLATGSLQHASTNSNHNTKIAGKSPQHKPGKECPEGNANCHWHYTGWCHKNPATCPLALQAITASFHAHGEWRHAPAGWNEAHQSCIRVENPVMCPFHAQLARSVFGSSYN